MHLATTQDAEHPVLKAIRRQGEIAAEIQALTGCAADVARMAAGSYLAFPTSPDWGLSAASFSTSLARTTGHAALTALRAWVADQAVAPLMAAE